MLNINVTELKNIINKIDTYNAQDEEIIINLFKILEETSMSWEDNKSYEFRNKIQEDKKEAFRLLQTLKDQNNINKLLCDKYDNIGKRIIYNSDSKEKILKELDDNYKYSISIAKDFEKIDTNAIYPIGRMLLTEKEKLLSISKKIEEVRSFFILLCKNIEDIEKRFNIELQELEEINIEPFNLENIYDGDKSVIGPLEQFEKNTKIISLYINEEANSLKDIYQSMTYFEDKYGDGNRSIILNNLNKLNNNINKIYTKRKAYISLLNTILNKYTNLFNQTRKSFEGMDDIL